MRRARLGRRSAVAIGAAAVVAAGSGLLEVVWLGASRDGAFARVERRVRQQFADLTVVLRRTAASLADHPAVRDGVSGDRAALVRLFDLTRTAVSRSAPDLAVTVHDAASTARAWSGRPSELPVDRILADDAAFFVTSGPLGLRLVYVEPIVAPAADGAPRRVGSVSAERVLSRIPGPDPETWTSSPGGFMAPVMLRARAGAPAPGPGRRMFTLRSPAGAPLIDAGVDDADLDAARAAWRRRVRDLLLALAAVAIGGAALAGLARAPRGRTAAAVLRGAGPGAAGLIAAAGLLWIAATPGPDRAALFSAAVHASRRWPALLRSPADILLAGLLLTAAAAAAVRFVAAARLPWRRLRAGSRRAGALAGHAAAGAAAGALLAAGDALLADTIGGSRVDLLEWSLTPWDPARVGLRLGLLLIATASIWLSALALIAADARWSRRRAGPRLVVAAWTLPGLLLAAAPGPVVPAGPFVLLLAGAAAIALAAPRFRTRFRRTSESGRLATALAALVLPALLAYPSIVRYGVAARQRFIETEFAPAVVGQPAALRDSLSRARAEIDARIALALRPPASGPGAAGPPLAGAPVAAALAPDALASEARAPAALASDAQEPAALASGAPGASGAARPPAASPDVDAARPPAAAGPPAVAPEAAFAIWRETELARRRLTSAIEIYGPDGALVSRFALNFPEDAAPAPSLPGGSCEWVVYGEVSRFGSQERRVLHAERAICPPGVSGTSAAARAAGAVIVHVPLDYGSLPFLPPQSPSYDLPRPAAPRPAASRIDPDVSLAIYGWSLSPLFTAGAVSWTIDDALFDRIYASREPFWTTVRAGGRTAAVYIANDRGGIYALGLPVLTPFDHLLRTAAIVALLAGAFGAAVVVLLLAGPLFPRRDRPGRQILREIRTSFSRRLFLAFAAVAVVPVLVLAVLIRNYSTAQLRSDIEAGAARTAMVAQRVIAEIQQARQPAEAAAALPLTDDLLVLVSQLIDQDINLFEGSQLVATSERDLFASGLLPTRTPAAVYNAVVLSQASAFVAGEAVGAGEEYLVAAAPIRSAGADAVLTVPLASRQRDIERQIRAIDRGILLGVTLLVVLGAVSGFYIAERIADPVQRLTRATRRIARGDFDARLATRAADELERLVAAFNRMAGDLLVQRRQLERTHRLEAWAEMARQVAHEIKNPLTPVQLSAEHLRRVHRDRGAPLGAVLEDCVASILRQVRLLRQIASEFSSYASSPAVQRAPTALADVVRDVIDAYRPGLDGRIRVTVDVPPDLPPVEIDRTLVGRALTNVVENALQAMPGDGALTVIGRLRAGAVELAVRDTGVGLEADLLARVFEPYFSTKASGTGLGMAIARRNVELTGGGIAVASRKGAGTTVTLTWPPAPAEPAPVEPAPVEPAGVADDPHGAGNPARPVVKEPGGR